jgi:hypothetical protein
MAGAEKRRFNRTEKLAALKKLCKGIKNEHDRDPPDEAVTRPSRDRLGNLALSLAARFAMTALGTSRCRPLRPRVDRASPT